MSNDHESLAWDWPSPFTLEVEVKDDQIDLLGHTNNCEYLKWCEMMAWAHSEHLGLGIREYRELGYGMAAVHTELDYLAATFAGEKLAVATWVRQCDRISLTRHYQIIRPVDAVVVLRAHTRFVCVDLESGKVRRMPPAFVTGYAEKTGLKDAK
ncbi:MAG: acyl-CoA thioesterase [Pseudomonadota bacterium]